MEGNRKPSTKFTEERREKIRWGLSNINTRHKLRMWENGEWRGVSFCEHHGVAFRHPGSAIILCGFRAGTYVSMSWNFFLFSHVFFLFYLNFLWVVHLFSPSLLFCDVVSGFSSVWWIWNFYGSVGIWIWGDLALLIPGVGSPAQKGFLVWRKTTTSKSC